MKKITLDNLNPKELAGDALKVYMLWKLLKSWKGSSSPFETEPQASMLLLFTALILPVISHRDKVFFRPIFTRQEYAKIYLRFARRLKNMRLVGTRFFMKHFNPMNFPFKGDKYVTKLADFTQINYARLRKLLNLRNPHELKHFNALACLIFGKHNHRKALRYIMQKARYIPNNKLKSTIKTIKI